MAVAVLVTLTASLAPQASTVALADDGPDPALDAAVAWLATQPTTGHDLEDRIDLALAYLVAGAPSDLVDPLLDEIAFLLGEGAEVTARTLAKVVIALDVRGRSLVVAGQRDLAVELRGTVGHPPEAPGQYRPEFGTEISTQAWGILAELRLGGTAEDETTFLLTRQCPDGPLVAAPTLQSCAQAVNVAEQAMALTALVAAERSGVATADGTGDLVDWVEQRWDPAEATWPATAASALSWLVWPLEVQGRAELATGAQDQLRALQLTRATALDAGQVGAIGGEDAVLVQDLLHQRLDPSPRLTTMAIHGLHPVELSEHRYASRPSLYGLPPAPPRVAGLDRADPGATVRFLAQGFVPAEEVTVSIRGRSGIVARATADDTGTATLSFTAEALDVTGQELVFVGASGATVARVLSVTRPLVDKADSIGGGARGGAAGEVDPFELTPAQALLGSLALLLVLAGAATVLRPRT